VSTSTTPLPRQRRRSAAGCGNLKDLPIRSARPLHPPITHPQTHHTGPRIGLIPCRYPQASSESDRCAANPETPAPGQVTRGRPPSAAQTCGKGAKLDRPGTYPGVGGLHWQAVEGKQLLSAIGLERLYVALYAANMHLVLQMLLLQAWVSHMSPSDLWEKGARCL
jgi:hypothetical protein